VTLQLTFHGAAGQVTGSLHLLEAAGARIALDAGLFQGPRAATAERNRQLPFDARRLDAVILSHAHIDHSGRLPLLVRHGFRGPVYATPATRDLCAVMLSDAALIQERDAEYLEKHGRKGEESEPLYTLGDAVAVQDLMLGVPYRRVQHVRKHLSFEFTDAGHILGSATVGIRITEGGRPHRLVYSGDIGRPGLPIVRDPDPPSGPVDTLIIEATYGDRDHEPVADAARRLGELVRRVAGRGGRLMIPAFALGRAQEIIYILHELFRSGDIPGIPIYVDSPLALDATAVFRMHPEIFDRHEPLVSQADDVFDFPLVRYVRSVEESRQLNGLTGPAVIIAASGMAEGGRILHHLKNHAGDHRNMVLAVGFQAENTLGRRIQQEQTPIRIFGEMVERRAEVETITGLSAHAGRSELQAWVRALDGPVERAFVVHGEAGPALAMARLLEETGVREVIVPRHGESFAL
jgi:metallo-beta-lactamase family protein